MVTLTDSASKKLSELLSQQTEPVAGLRLTAQQGGCSGFQYGMSFAAAAQPGDWVGEFGGVKVFVDPQSAPELKGVEVDWIETLQNTGFAFRNPNAVRSCGCGKSFETH
jgi:iron-sulfur cluster assembly accessory protein